MTSYRQTIQKHRLLLAMPIVIVFVLALWATAGAPKKYEASASLWVDNVPPAPSSLTINDPSIKTPADQQQTLITELLQTRDFRVKVGQEGPLAKYLASNPSKGWGPTGLLAKLKGGESSDAAIIGQLGAKQFTTFVAGPQVLQLSYIAGTPDVAAGTLSTVIKEVAAQQAKFEAARERETVAYNQAQVKAATKALDDANGKLIDYQRQHPDANATDPVFVALQRTARAAKSDLASKTTALNQSSIVQPDPTGANPSTSAGFSVIDPPKAPAGPVSGKKKLVMGAFGGLFAGFILSLLALIALTPSKSQEPQPVGYYEMPHLVPSPRPLHPVAPQPVNGSAPAVPAAPEPRVADPRRASAPRSWTERS